MTPGEDDRSDAPVHQESMADRDIYAAGCDITLIRNYFQESPALPRDLSVARGSSRDAGEDDPAWPGMPGREDAGLVRSRTRTLAPPR